MSWQRGQRDLTALKVGAAVLTGLIILIGGLLWGQDMLRRSGTMHMSVLFDSGFGLKTGDPVLVAGVKKGHVTQIDLTRANRVAVGMRLDEDVRLNSASLFTIESEGIIGSRYINVISNPGGRPMAEGDTLIGLNAAGLNDVFRSVQLLMGQVSQLTTSLQSILTDEVMRDQLRQTYENFNQTIQLLNRVVVDNQDLVRESLENLSVVVENVNKALVANMDDLEAALQSMRRSGDAITNTAGSVDTLASGLTAVAARFAAGTGTLWRLTESDSLYVELSSTLELFRALLADIKSNPHRYFTIRIW